MPTYDDTLIKDVDGIEALLATFCHMYVVQVCPQIERLKHLRDASAAHYRIPHCGSGGSVLCITISSCCPEVMLQGHKQPGLKVDRHLVDLGAARVALVDQGGGDGCFAQRP